MLMRLLAPAKINLHLRVGPPNPDGFHPLLSWFCTVGLFDTLTLKLDSAAAESPPHETAHATPGSPVISLATDRTDLPTDEKNLVVRVAKALADTPSDESRREDADRHAGRREGVSAFLEKRIPMGAGLGGGSSDAARALLGLNNLWGIGWSAQRLSEFASQFGSDLPFFFHGPSSVCTGRGEVVKPVPPPSVAKWVVLALPDIHMPTAAVYGRFDELDLGFDEHIDEGRQPDWCEWSSRKSKDLLAGLVNDLERPAFEIRKDLGTLRADIELKLGRPVRMSGSGSSLFTLYDERREAEAAANIISTSFGVPRTLAIEMTPAVNDDLADAAETNNVAPPPR